MVLWWKKWTRNYSFLKFSVFNLSFRFLKMSYP